MIYSITLMVVGAVLAVTGFHLMKPKDGDISIGGGAYVQADPEERPPFVQQAGKILLGIGVILFVGGLVWILSTLFMALAGIVLVAAIVGIIWYVVRSFVQ